LIINFFLKI
jgi:hypothetical protein